MLANELREKSVSDLEADLLSFKREQFNLRFQAASGDLENTARIRVVRRNIARIKTIMRQKSGI